MDKKQILEAVASMDTDRLESAHVELTEATAGDSGLVLVIINEQHTLMDDQIRAIVRDFCDGVIAPVKIPADTLQIRSEAVGQTVGTNPMSYCLCISNPIYAPAPSELGQKSGWSIA